MPYISRFYGITIYIYYEMDARHHEPHFHAIYGDDDASYLMNPLSLVAGQLPRRQHRLVLTWAKLHEQELIENWRRAIAGQPLVLIEGLR